MKGGEGVKKCIKCGKEIVNGVNGCMLLNKCFDCHGGYPDYSRNQSNIHWSNADWDALDTVEGKCMKGEYENE